MINADDLDAFGYWSATEPKPKPRTISQMVKEFAVKTGQLPQPDLYATLIQEEADEWRSEYVNQTREAQLKELADLVYVVYGYANAMGWDLYEAVVRVHENNLGRCIQPDGSVQRRADGKILKNKDYPTVDLSDLV
jgi:NTP pyrophosphatase (non-canonical NTP hydrolase)